jgi:hypothetical protein
MSNNTKLTLFNSPQLPSYLADAFSDEETNLVVAESIPTLTFRGKQFRIRIGGEEHLLQRTVDGELYPVPSIKVIVLDVNPNRSRTFFEGAYVSGENRAPDCWSNDGKEPDPTVAQPQAKTCAACPKSVKGSRITDNGKEVSACTTNRKLAVIPWNKLDMEPLLLKVPQTSMWDKDNKENEAQGFFAWDQYVAFLRGRGVPHTAAVVTQIKFDNTEYPKLLFSAHSWVEGTDMATVKELVHSQAVADIINKSDVAKNGDHAPETEPQSADAAPKPEPKPEPEVKPAPKPASRKKAKPAPKPAPEPDTSDDDGDDTDWGGAATPEPKTVEAAGKGKKVAQTPAIPPTTEEAKISGLADLAASWDDVDD